MEVSVRLDPTEPLILRIDKPKHIIAITSSIINTLKVS